MIASVLLAQPAIANRENEALALAQSDLRTIPKYDQRYIRWVWIEDGERESFQAVALTVNFINQTQLIYRPYPVMDGRTLLARIDLRKIVPYEYLEQTLRTWEQFAFDPRFNLLLTKDTIRFATGLAITVPDKRNKRLVDVPEYIHPKDGKRYTQKWVYDDLNKNDVVRVIGEHIDYGLIAALIDGTYSQAPVVSHRYFIFRALSTIKDDGLYRDLFGGLYYDLAGIPQKSKKGSDFDNLLASLGVGDVQRGVTAKDVFDKLRSDARTAVFRSDVTGTSRAIIYLRHLAGKLGESESIIVITLDFKRKSIDISQHAMMNLINVNFDASEVIFEKSNGLQGFALYDAKGKLLDQATSDVVVDRTVPTPHSTDLQPAIGCIRCHGPELGWRKSRNDVKKRKVGDFDIIADVNFRNQQDAIDRIAGLYTGDLEETLLPNARNNYARAVLRSTGTWKGSKDQTDIVRLASAKIGKIYGDWWYNQVDAKRMTDDLGIKARDRKEAAAILMRLLPPVPVVLDANRQVIFGQKRTEALRAYHAKERIPYDYVILFQPEDIRLQQLKEDGTINAIDYYLTFAYAARRIQISSKK